MKKITIEFAFDGSKETAHGDMTVNGNETTYLLTPENKSLNSKFGKTTFRQKEGEFLSGEPIDDLAYFSALKEGLENFLYDKKE